MEAKGKGILQKNMVPQSTLSTILKNQNSILQKSSENLSHKRRRIVEFPDIEECLIKWFKQCRENNVSLGGLILKEKALFFAKFFRTRF